LSKIIPLAEARGSLRATAIFVHGLGGDPLSTWTSAGAPGDVWPKWLAADVDGLAVRSVGYDASVSRWRGTAMHLPDRANNLFNRLLLEDDLATSELILIGHSLGGLLIKAMLRRAEAQARDDARAASLLERVRKVAFLATPHGGADLAEWGDRLRILVLPSAATAGLVRNDPHLRELNQWYRGFARKYAIEHLILTETRAMRILGTIVKPDSGDPGLEVDPVPIDADHVDIVKPEDRDSDVYRHVRDFLARRRERPVSREERKIAAVDAKLDALLAAVDARGLERQTVLRIAQRLAPETLTLEQAIVELERAVEIALDVIARGERGTNEDGFLADILARLGELTKRGEFDAGAREVDAALVELARRRAEQEDAYRRQRRTLLEAGVEQDSLRRDAAAVARRTEEIAEAEHPGERLAWTKTFREFWDRYYEEGLQKGVNFSLEIAIALARRMTEEAGDANQKGDAGNLLGNALAAIGERESGTARLEAAVAAFSEALKEMTRERVPLDWAATQNNLGIALCVLGSRESGTGRLEAAVAAYSEALKEYTRERVPLNWAMTQNNLGNALQLLGERESGKDRLEAAVAAYTEALKERMRERVPVAWASTQNNLGNALQLLGERESGTDRLEAAVAAYTEALKERTRERFPLDWATTQNNLGNALRVLGERESEKDRLEAAVTAYSEALKESTRERVPLDWAMTQNNLGNALRALGEWESGTERLEAAVAAYTEALKERTRERVPLDWAMTQNNLGVALKTLGSRESGTDRLEAAVAAYAEALKEWTRERVPLDWALTQHNLGDALQILGERESWTDRLEAAVAAYTEALKERTRERVPVAWASTQNNLGNALQLLGERESGTDRLEAAVAAYTEALKERTRERFPLAWALTQNNLGNALCALGERESGTDRLEAAVAAFFGALTVFKPEVSPRYFDGTQRNLSRALALLAERRKAGGG